MYREHVLQGVIITKYGFNWVCLCSFFPGFLPPPSATMYTHTQLMGYIPDILLIDVAKRSTANTSGRDDVLDRKGLRVNLEVEDVVKSTGAAGRGVVDGDGSGNDTGALGGVLVLPDPPDAVDLAVVDPEGRVTRAGKDVTGRVALEGEVAASVNAILALGKVTLHDVLEGANVGAVGNEIGRVALAGVAAADPRANVTADAAGVVGEKTGGGGDTVGDEGRGDGAEVDLHVLEGAILQTAAAVSGRHAVKAGGQGWGAAVLGIDTVAAERRVAAVEDGRLERVLGPAPPVPVGLVALVSTLVAERLLERVGEPPMPRQEVGRAVNGQRLVDVHGDEVVIPRLGSGYLGRVVLGRLAHQTLDGSDVVFALGLGEGAPRGCQEPERENLEKGNPHHSLRLAAFSTVHGPLWPDVFW